MIIYPIGVSVNQKFLSRFIKTGNLDLFPDSLCSSFISVSFSDQYTSDLVFVGIHPEDYMRTWNRMIDRQRRKVYYYEDENDEEHMKIEKVETRPK